MTEEWMDSTEFFQVMMEDCMIRWMEEYFMMRRTRRVMEISTRKYRARRKRR